MSKAKKGRLVWNHSTHLEGLIPILEQLTTYEGITTITPGVLSRSRSHCPKMKIRVSTPLKGGFKLIARYGKSVQEVFVIAQLEQPELESLIAKLTN